MKPRIMFYCQHVLGMGHLIRSIEIVKAFTDWEVLFLNGGERLPDLILPPFIRVVDLPAIVSDAQFDTIQSADSTQTLADIQRTRTHRLLSELHRFQPDVLIIELFPFGRIRFGFELIPTLARIRLEALPVRVVCSLRDILVSKSDQTRHEEWVCSLINRYFDALLVHADPAFQQLDETFARVPDLKVPIHYTGFVAQSLPDTSADLTREIPSKPEGAPLIMASIGGGRVGYELLESVIQATLLLQPSYPCRLVIFTGPYLPQEQWDSLERLISDHPFIALKRYTNQFLAFLKQADLSISMGGYNTCMNLLTTGTRAMVFPFMGRGNEEQTIRARKLAALGMIHLLSPAELNPEALALRIKNAVSPSSPPTRHPLNVRGAANTAEILRTMVQGDLKRKDHSRKQSDRKESVTEWGKTLRQALNDLEGQGKRVSLFLRDDDIDQDEDTLRTLMDITLSLDIPVNLEVIPGRLSPQTVRFLKNLKRINPTLVELNQHGWKHENHEPAGRKSEFGPSRTFEEQFHDISKGKTILENTLEFRFHPVFTPPWNRCTPDTYKVLDELGFKILSKDQGKQIVSGYAFREISTTLDLYRWKGTPQLKSREEIIAHLVAQLCSQRTVGLLLHHKVMDAEAFEFLDDLLTMLKDCPMIEFHTFESLAEAPQ